MLPWFFPRHIFSDRQEAFVSAPRVRDSSTEMGKENRRFTSGRVLVCPFLFGSASVCVQIPYPRGLLSLKTGFEGSVLTCPLSAPPWSLASLWAGRRHLTDTCRVFRREESRPRITLISFSLRVSQRTVDEAIIWLRTLSSNSLSFQGSGVTQNVPRFPAQRSRWKSQRQPRIALGLLGSEWDWGRFYQSNSSSGNCL